MPVACWPIVHFVASHVADATTRAGQHLTVPIGRHHVHRVAHAMHTAAAHPRIWIQTVCRVIPGAVAATILATPPIYTTPGVHRGIMPPPVMSPAAPLLGALPPSAPPRAAADPIPGSTLLFFPPPSAPAVTPPVWSPPPYVTVSPTPPTDITPDVPPQSVPEPDSTSVLILAIGSLIVISRMRHSRAQGDSVLPRLTNRL